MKLRLKLSVLVSVIALALIGSCSQPAGFSPNAGIDEVATIQLQTAAPEEMGLKSEVLEKELTELLGANKTGAACLFVKGKLVWEHYWNDFSF